MQGKNPDLLYISRKASKYVFQIIDILTVIGKTHQSDMSNLGAKIDTDIKKSIRLYLNNNQ
jgi:hypothetical protein